MKFPRSSRTGMEAAILAEAGTDEEAAREPMVESWSWLDIMASVLFLDLTHVERRRQIGSLRGRRKREHGGSIKALIPK
jgi:hypothetical protein